MSRRWFLGNWKLNPHGWTLVLVAHAGGLQTRNAVASQSWDAFAAEETRRARLCRGPPRVGEEVGKGQNATHVEERRFHTASRAFAPKRALDSGLYSRV